MRETFVFFMYVLYAAFIDLEDQIAHNKGQSVIEVMKEILLACHLTKGFSAKVNTAVQETINYERNLVINENVF
jgi:hypothetical protein